MRRRSLFRPDDSSIGARPVTDGARHVRRPSTWRRVAGLAIALSVLVPLAPALRDRLRPPPPRESDRYLIGRAAFERGDHEAAIEAFRASIADAPRAPRAYRDLVDAHVRRGDLASAESFLRDLADRDPRNPSPRYALGKLAFARHDLATAQAEAEAAVGLDPAHAYARLLLGLTHYTAGRPERAEREWRRARGFFARARDRLGEALALNNLAMLHLDLHDYARAEDEFERTLAIHEELENLPGQTLALMNLGLTRIDRGAFEEAISILRRGLPLARAQQDRPGEGRILEYLCDAIEKTGEYGRALECADTLLCLATASGDRLMETAGRLHVATARADLGDLLPALAAGTRALTLAESLRHPRYLSAALLLVAETELCLGRRAEARARFLACDSVARAARVEATSAMAQMGLCLLARAEGDTTEAFARGERALRLCAAIGYVEGEGQAAAALAGLARARGDFPRALELSDRGVALSRRVGRRIDEARALARRADVLLARGDRRRAQQDAGDALRLARSTGSLEAFAIASLASGDAAGATDAEVALEHYEAGMRAVESVQGRLRLDEFKAGYLDSRLELYRRAVALLVDLDRPVDAFQVSERCRARALRDLLAGRQPRAGDFAEADGRHLGAQGTATPAQAWAADELERVSARMGRDSLLLEYFLAPWGSYSFVLDAGGVDVVKLPVTDREVAGVVAALCRPWHAPRSLGTISFDRARASRLRRALLDPVLAGRGEVSRLYIVPDGALSHLPFEMLPWDDGPLRAETFLDDLMTVSYLPSAGYLAWEPTRRARDAERRRDPSAPSGHRQDGEGLLVMAPSSGLRHAADEAGRIGALFAGSVVLCGPEASEAAFRELAPRFRRLHVSTHGIVDPASPWHAGLMLSRSGPDDGCLHAAEVLSLELDCDLATLSACETGLGRLYAGEGWLGLSRAFLCAGAQSVVVSLWPVHDASTALLMERFYQEIARGADPAEALRSARRGLRLVAAEAAPGIRVSYAHPFFWAPFVLIGESRREREPAAVTRSS